MRQFFVRPRGQDLRHRPVRLGVRPAHLSWRGPDRSTGDVAERRHHECWSGLDGHVRRQPRERQHRCGRLRNSYSHPHLRYRSDILHSSAAGPLSDECHHHSFRYEQSGGQYSGDSADYCAACECRDRQDPGDYRDRPTATARSYRVERSVQHRWRGLERHVWVELVWNLQSDKSAKRKLHNVHRTFGGTNRRNGHAYRNLSTGLDQISVGHGDDRRERNLRKRLSGDDQRLDLRLCKSRSISRNSAE